LVQITTYEKNVRLPKEVPTAKAAVGSKPVLVIGVASVIGDDALDQSARSRTALRMHVDSKAA
jgi:hypothetical protein